MRILHICPRYFPANGGAEIFAKTIAEWNVKSHNSVDVWTSDAYEVDALWFPGKKKVDVEKEVINGVHVRRFKTTPFLMNNLFLNKSIRYLLVHAPFKFLRILGTPPTCFGMWKEAYKGDLPKYDVVHVMAMPFFSLIHIAKIIAKRTGAKLYLTSFTHLGTSKNDPLRKVYFDKVAINQYLSADKIFVQTDAEQRAITEFLKESGKKISQDRFERAGIGVFPEEVLGGNGYRFRKKYDIKEPIVFSVGAKVFVKGYFTLIKAMEIIWKKGERAKLVLAGNNSMEFESFWKKRSALVKKNTLNLDFISDEEKKDLFSAGDIFSLTSKSESFGIVYLESWLYKKPVIGCTIESVKEVINAGEDGYLVPFDDEKALASKIERLLADSRTRKMFGENGYKKVMEKYTWESKFEILSKYFNERSKN